MVEDFGILYIVMASKWPVLFDKCIGKLIVVCNLYNYAIFLCLLEEKGLSAK